MSDNALAPGLEDLVIYHDECDDGFCAAWLHWRQGARRAGVEYWSAQYGDKWPQASVTGKRVLIVDFSYPRSILEDIREKAKSLRVLDHHKTAEAELRGLPYCTFDMNKSGGRLMQEYLGANRNWLVDYTEDRDLWRWKLPDSRAISAALRSWPREFDLWESLYDGGRAPLADDGMAILRANKRAVADAIKGPGWAEINGHTVPCVNVTGKLISETVGALAEAHPEAPFAAGFFVLPNRDIVFSLRSRGEFDVSAVARSFGGGGHAAAAGFKTRAVLPFLQGQKP